VESKTQSNLARSMSKFPLSTNRARFSTLQFASGDRSACWSVRALSLVLGPQSKRHYFTVTVTIKC